MERIRIEAVQGPRASYLDDLLVGDADVQQIGHYLNQGELDVVYVGNEKVGVAQLIPIDDKTIELKNIGIHAKWQRRGIGGQVVRYLMHQSAAHYQTMLVGTANSSIGNIIFYQRLGFRMYAVKRGFFDQYSEPIYENDIQAHDMLLFTQNLAGR
ncbi:hypothetical protein IV38_GL000470 [Lactobacillus selangorensis]|uniref:N-acetyltransferase domain-containing protein n=1 Tax=Lactobacillus selangorensis TaxID=81857 RepID=A0A0R2FM53_9LACO|nr:GNAT family N-acetyltransferase [Lactobacillus selangorensis]KRN29584.1 hypothetical protein IV38_GL000470 [Lactobacillus selangorensis]KRN33886.1 hypothetical protein IV40_GL000198 [Lactobacillus selangorensis]